MTGHASDEQGDANKQRNEPAACLRIHDLDPIMASNSLVLQVVTTKTHTEREDGNTQSNQHTACVWLHDLNPLPSWLLFLLLFGSFRH